MWINGTEWRLVPVEPTAEWVAALAERGMRIGTLRNAIADVLAAAPQADSVPAPLQEPVWDGKLSDTMQKALNALYLECSHEVAGDVAFCVRKELEAIYTSYNTVKRMYGAARDRLEAMEAAQPQPDPFSRAPADGVLADVDPLQGAANWLAEAHGQFCVAVLQWRLMIGYNRAKRLHDAAIAARKQGANHDHT